MRESKKKKIAKIFHFSLNFFFGNLKIYFSIFFFLIDFKIITNFMNDNKSISYLKKKPLFCRNFRKIIRSSKIENIYSF